MDTSTMAYPFGRCASCGKEFNSELRDEYEIAYCPWCGQLILDCFHDTNPPPGLLVKPDTDRYIYCEECGTRIYERIGKGGRWIDTGDDKKGHGVCSGPCERELCARCGDWDDEGCCPMCALPCDVCSIEGCEKRSDICKNPCASCSMKNDCLSESNDKRHECQAFIEFNEKECGKKIRECPCGYVGDDFTKREVNESDAVFSCGQAEIWICPECGKEIAETKEADLG